MPHPTRPLAALALSLALLAAAAAGCTSTESNACPGTVIGRFGLHAWCDPAPTATSCLAGPAAGWLPQVPACIPAVSSPATCAEAFDGPTACTGQAPLVATFTTDGAGQAALCTGRRLGDELVGTIVGQVVDLHATTDGAVVGACAATCRARLTVHVQGTITPAAGATAARFDGTIVEQLDAVDAAACGSCQLPCTSTWTARGEAL